MWFRLRAKTVIPIEVFFNIDPSLFYVWTSTPATVDQEGNYI